MSENKEKKKINFKENLKEVWSISKKRKASIFFLFFISAIMQVLNLADKFIFREVISNSEKYLAQMIDIDGFVRSLVWMLVVYFIILVINGFIVWFQFHVLNRFEVGIVFDLKRKYFNHIVDLDYKFHSNHKTGSLISRLGRGSGAIENFFDTIIFNFSPLLIQVVILIPSFFRIGFYQTLIFVLMVVFYIVYSLYFIKKTEKQRILVNKAEDLEKANVADVFTNIESIKYFGKEKQANKKFNNYIEDTRERKKVEWDWWRYIATGQKMIFGISFLLLFYVSFRQFIDNEINLSDIAFTYTIFLGIMGPVNWFNWGIKNISRSMVDLQDLFEYSQHSNEIKDKENAITKNIRQGAIEFKNMTFGYHDAKQKLFKHFNLKIEPGERVAFVGESGSGKTTLVKLLYRFYDLDKGQILVDGTALTDFKQEFIRSEMSIVPQEPILFDDTVYNNIKFSNPKAPRKEVFQAMKFAQLDSFVKDLPKKENTIVGERGIKLSGGQKQRVSIARAILADKKILVLDEATSALDSETEYEIQKDLDKLMQGRTSIVIAHRLSTIMKSDKIVVLKDGMIIQVGTHGELIAETGEYQKLWSLQKNGFLQE